MKDDRIYLRHILDAIRMVEEYMHQNTATSLRNDKRTLDAVVRELEIIGEATAHLSEEFRISHKEIPYEDIVGMRNRLIHGYFDVDVDAISQTCEEDLPMLKQIVESYLKSSK